MRHRFTLPVMVGCIYRSNTGRLRSDACFSWLQQLQFSLIVSYVAIPSLGHVEDTIGLFDLVAYAYSSEIHDSDFQFFNEYQTTKQVQQILNNCQSKS